MYTILAHAGHAAPGHTHSEWLVVAVLAVALVRLLLNRGVR